ncbi:MAG TPA: SGNH/GDSL hydrolase family protein [Sphingopyxis sp.]|nr:SGNH/GDSL hydrolase family protein [Sphingopyxis sp.]
MRKFWKTLAAPTMALLLAGAAAPDGTWTPAWTASMWQSGNPRQEVAVDNATISFAVRVGADGKALRIRLSNEFGAAFRIGAASIRLRDGQTVPVTFGGKAATEVSANTSIVSDPVRLTVKSFDVVDVSLYLPGSVRFNTVHAAGGAKTQISAPGDHSRAPFVAARRTDNRPLLASVDVLGDATRPVVVAFGDSITDNPGCAIDATPICRWSDVLGRRLAKAGKPHVVVTQAISGNRVISRGTGPSAVERFDRDVLALPGVTHVVLLEGINDIGGSGRARPDGTSTPTITDAELIAGYRDLVSRAHQRGIKVIAMTILPFEGAGYHSATGEAMRTRINAWIRSSGTFDAVVDMEKVVADPANPRRLAPALHRGDFLHPNGEGEFAMGEAIPLDLFD